MKNICFITLGNLYLCPYLEFYLRQINGPYTVIFWDREQRNETANGKLSIRDFLFHVRQIIILEKLWDISNFGNT